MAIMPIPKEVTDSLMNDKDFLAMSDSDQNQMLDRIGAKYGSMAKPENILQRASQNLTSPTTAPLGHIGMGDVMVNPLMNAARLGVSAAGIPEENLAPIIGQVAGGAIAGFPGAVGGEGLGEIARQGGKFARGQKLTPQDIPIGMGITAVTEGAPRALFNTYFGKQIAAKGMETLNQGLSAIKSSLSSDPTAMVATEPIVKKLSGIYDGLAGPLKDQASELKNWIEELATNPTGQVHASHLEQMEKSLGASADYSKIQGGSYQFAKQTQDPVINKAMQEARKVASDAYDNLAVSKGHTEFPEMSRQVSELSRKWSDINPAKDKASFFGKMAIAALAGKETGSLPVGMGTYIAENLLTNPAVKSQMFGGLTNPIVNAALTAGRVGGSEAARDIIRT